MFFGVRNSEKTHDTHKHDFKDTEMQIFCWIMAKDLKFYVFDARNWPFSSSSNCQDDNKNASHNNQKNSKDSKDNTPDVSPWNNQRIFVKTEI